MSKNYQPIKNNNNHDDTYSAVIMNEVIARVHSAADPQTMYRKAHRSRGIGLWLVLLVFHVVIDGSFDMR